MAYRTVGAHHAWSLVAERVFARIAIARPHAQSDCEVRHFNRDGMADTRIHLARPAPEKAVHARLTGRELGRRPGNSARPRHRSFIPDRFQSDTEPDLTPAESGAQRGDSKPSTAYSRRNRGYALLTVTAGICEEIIFRGYLQRQFSVFFRSAAAGVMLQGVIFGASHGCQGPKFMVIIVVYGVLFGLLAQSRRSLRPGMFGHFLQDLIVGIAAGRFMK
jgi:hypothetical protein